MKKVEVYILAGFLGSGKTSLLQNLLEQEKRLNRNVAVLMNEFGEFSVDSNLVGDKTPLKELLKGCICCTMKDEVEIQLLSLYQEHKPDVIYIETTGIAHPIEVLDACLSPLIAPYIEMNSIVTVVDVNRWNDRQHLNNKIKKLLEEQVQYSDNILLNKMDLISETDLNKVRSEIRSLNSRAKIHVTRHSLVPLSELRERDESFVNTGEKVNAKEHLHIQSMTYSFSVPINKDRFDDWLRSMPDTIFRIKGFIRFVEDKTMTYIFQYSYGVPYYIPEPIKYPTNLVFIGDKLDKEKIKAELEQLEKSVEIID